MSGCRHYRALMYKNYILWKRNILGSLCEMLFPCVMMLILLAIRVAVSTTSEPGSSYLDYMQAVKTTTQTTSIENSYSSLLTQGYNNSPYSDPSGDGCPFDQNFDLCNKYSGEDSEINTIGLSPDTGITRYLASQISTACNLGNYTVEFFTDDAAIEDKVQSWSYESDHKKFCFSVSFNSYTDNDYNYVIRFNRTETPIPSGKIIGDFIEPFFFDMYTAMDDLIVNPETQFQQRFAESGFYQLMNWIDNYILQQITGLSTAYISVAFVPMYFDNYVKDSFANTIQFTVPIFLTISYMVPVCRMISQIVMEKETKIKETMLMMGLSRVSYWLSWLSYYGLVYLFITIINTIISIAVFKHSNHGIIFVTLLLYAFACMGLSTFMSVIFSRSRSGVLVGLCFFFITYFIFFAVSDNTKPYSQKVPASLALNTALGLIMNVLSALENAQLGVQNDNLTNVYNNYTYATGLGFFALDGAIFFILAFYLEQVWPQDWGVSQPWYFPFTKTFWCPDRAVPQELKENVKWGPSVEPVDETLESQKETGKAMIVRNFRKVFGDNVAVDDLNLDIYEGQIFALLGHNGAGKTTTFSMLTGLLPPTQGEMTVHNKLLSKDLGELRKEMGVCPQHNVLFADLNIEEHLEMFCVFKGLSNSAQVKAQVNYKIREVDLESKRKTLAKNLSGGQKRRLSLAIALIADSPIVLLDEPTSGMDLTARRQMWDMLKNNKPGRIIILTTHYMEEADILADRIAIMSKGKLRCMGSSLFLKNRYGVGYSLTIVKELDAASSEHSAQVIDFIRRYIPEAVLSNDIHAEISFKLPLDSSSLFDKFFDELDHNLKRLSLKNYAISVTTLEEVFIRVAHGDDNVLLDKTPNKPDSQDIELKSPPYDEGENALIPDPDFILERDRQISSQLLPHIGILLKKRFLITSRDIKGILFEVFIPIAMILFGLGLMIVTGFYKDYDPIVFKISEYDTPQNILYGYKDDPTPILTVLLNTNTDLQATNANTTTISDFDLEIDATQAAPTNHRAGSYWFEKTDTVNHQYEAVIFHNQTAFQSSATYYAVYSKAIFQSLDATVDYVVANQPYPPTTKMVEATSIGDGFLASIVFSLGFAFIPAGLISYVVSERENAIKHQHMVSGVSLTAYWSSMYIWDIVKHILPAVICASMIKAYNIEAFADGSAYGVCWVIILLYGVSIAPFTYCSSFLFATESAAMVMTVLINFTLGSLCPPAIYLLYSFSSTRSAGKVIRWILRIFPSFCFGMAFIDVSSADTFANYDGRSNPTSSFDMEAAGGDVLMICIDIVAYIFLLFILEIVETSPSVKQIFHRTPTIAPSSYTPDEEVEQEKQEAIAANPEDVKVNVKEVRQIYSNLEGCGFVHNVAVQEVSFNVHNKECFALLGVNGAGKTSTFRILTGEYTPTSGQAYIGGINVLTHLRDARKLIGYCPQFDAFNFLLTGYENLELYCVLKGIPVERRAELIDFAIRELDLEQYRNIKSGTYSGGNKRKLSVAIALLGSPSVMFLDEPSAGMDPEARKKMWKVIGNMKRRDASVILTTHSMEEVEALCDRLTIMVAGRLKCLGTPTQVKNKFGSGYEVDVKVLTPSKDEIAERLHVLGDRHPTNDHVTESNLRATLEALNAVGLLPQVSQTGTGAALYNQLKAEGFVLESVLATWVITEEAGQSIFNLLRANFERVSLIEHYLSFYKFKVEKQEDRSLGYLFGVLESNKVQYQIAEYSVSQTSLEQIFNMFAREAAALDR